jgi:RNA polymerase sigma-70 factor, ECF subfamily
MESTSVTTLLALMKAGNSEARAELLRLVYDELRTIAAYHMNRERPDHTLQPTALLHEAYMRLLQRHSQEWDGRAHFFAVASKEMRRVLVDHAREHNAAKRGGGAQRIDLNEALAYSASHAEEMLALDQALDRLAAIKPKAAEVVELLFFAGLTQDEASAVLGCDVRTVKRRWEFAKGFLRTELARERHDEC